MKKLLPAAALALALVPALAACGDTDDSTADGVAAASTSSEAQAASLTLTDPWVKAAPDGMTAAFGTLTNSGSEDVTVVGAATEANARTELHETVQNDDGSMAMQQKQGGFVVPAGGTHELEPGGDHIMLMQLTSPLEAGTTLTLILTLADGSTTTVDATVKAFDGADEEYQDGAPGEMGSGETGEMGGEH